MIIFKPLELTYCDNSLIAHWSPCLIVKAQTALQMPSYLLTAPQLECSLQLRLPHQNVSLAHKKLHHCGALRLEPAIKEASRNDVECI